MTFNSLLSVGEMVVRNMVKENQIVRAYKERIWLKLKQGVLVYFTKLICESEKDVRLKRKLVKRRIRKF